MTNEENQDNFTATSHIASNQLLLSQPPRHTYTVAIHIRRGDVQMCHSNRKPNERYLPSAYYLDLLDHFLPARRKRQAVVHVFSESGSDDNWTHFVDDAHRRGHKHVHVHLDTPDLALIWKIFVTANLLIQSHQSTFSLVPAMLNRHGTIVYTQSARPPLPLWKKAPKHILQRPGMGVLCLR